MNPFTQRVVQLIKDIPAGKVMTYGQNVRLAGNPRGARQVARILHSMSRKYHLPWHRVINSQGKISITEHEGYLLQKSLLQDEGVIFTDSHHICLNQYQLKLDCMESSQIELLDK